MRDSTNTWQKVLAEGFRSAHDLLDYLDLSHQHTSAAAEDLFATRVPKSFADLMEKGNPNDPLLVQVLATGLETEYQPAYTEDPLQEKTFNSRPGVIHKYHGRVLLVLTGACAINCRYCFRRHFAYEDNNPSSKAWLDIIHDIGKDTTINELILSGGDPLLASDKLIKNLIFKIESYPHIKTLRIHSRMPVVLPQRVTNELVHLLAETRLKTVVVLHTNHPNELSEDVFKACQLLKESGCHILNQSVLLKGVNDDVETLSALSQKLFECGVLPYYLHILDKVAGVHHFDVDVSQAKEMFGQLQERLPGYLVPKLAVEIPGKGSKTLLYSS